MSLAIALSIAIALERTPLPTYGTSSTSRSPCTVPSSPSGPCSNGITTMSLPNVGITDAVVAVPVASSCRAEASGVANTHCPWRVIPIGTSLYLSGSAALMTWAAVTQLTSCSADCPPNKTTTVARESGVFICSDGSRR